MSTASFAQSRSKGTSTRPTLAPKYFHLNFSISIARCLSTPEQCPDVHGTWGCFVHSSGRNSSGRAPHLPSIHTRVPDVSPGHAYMIPAPRPCARARRAADHHRPPPPYRPPRTTTLLLGRVRTGLPSGVRGPIRSSRRLSPQKVFSAWTTFLSRSLY